MRRLSPNEYAAIKQLLNMGHNANKVAMAVGRSWCVVNTVKKTMSYAEYIKQRRAQVRRAEENRKARQLPLDTPKKMTLDLREELAIKFNSLIDTVETLEVTVKNPKGGVIDLRKGIAFNRAKERLEEARLWLKEAL